jgi:rod shape-determining protein MreC
VVGPRRASRRRYVLLLVVLTAVTLITVDTRGGRSGPMGALSRAAHKVVSPIEAAVSSVARPIGDWFSGLTDSGHLKSENRKLRNQIAALKGQQEDASAAIAENKILKQAAGLNFEVSRVTARIINRSEGNFDPTLTINKGIESGIAKDQAVVAPDGSLVGKILQAWNGGAEVRVLTDPMSAVGVKTPRHLHSKATTGTAVGQNGSRDLVVDDFDPSAKILRGDSITTSPESQVFPADLRVGSVSSVREDPADHSVHVTITPYADIDALDYVVILQWAKGQPPVVVTATTTTTTLPSASATTSTSVSTPSTFVSTPST